MSFSRHPRFVLLALGACLALAAPTGFAAAATATADELMREAQAAEAKFDLARALDRYLAVEAAGRRDAFTLQKIARQYSDLASEQPTRAEQQRYARLALDYSQRATALEPNHAVNVLSIAISYGKLALASDTADKIRYSRLVRSEAERALALDPSYAWAHHVLGRWHMEVAALGAASRAFVSVFHGGLPKASIADAVRHFERAVELEPSELQHHVELGFAYRAQGDLTRARAALERGASMSPRAKIDVAAIARARATLETLPAPPQKK